DIRGLPERVLQFQTTWLTILEADVYVGKAGIALQRRGSDPLQSIPSILLNQTEGVFQIASTKQDRSRRSADGLVHTTLGDLGQIRVVLIKQLAVRHDQLFIRALHMPFELSRALKHELPGLRRTFGLAVAIDRTLGKLAFRSTHILHKRAQLLAGRSGHGQGRCSGQQHADQQCLNLHLWHLLRGPEFHGYRWAAWPIPNWPAPFVPAVGLPGYNRYADDAVPRKSKRDDS